LFVLKNVDFKVVLAPSWDLAKPFNNQVEASVEAEYGDYVVYGQIVTLAHHIDEFKDCPAPINSTVDISLPSGSTILVSHIDLDCIGGIMNITGNNIVDKGFQEAAEYIDVNGPHYMFKFPKEKAKIEAYWAWASKLRESSTTVIKRDEIVDITDVVIQHMTAIESILNGNIEMLENGEKYAIDFEKAIEEKLIEEDDIVRVFITDKIFCCAKYFSPKQAVIVPFTIQFHTEFKSITVACANPKLYNFVAKDFVQKLWGLEAGGKDGIAGSPRSQPMTLDDLSNAIEAIRNL
jgi:hypothetical protein